MEKAVNGTSNFLVFNEAQQNMMTDEMYLVHSQRQAGVIPGLADSKLHNKMYHQVSIMTAAIAELVKRNGLAASDVDLEGLVQGLKGTFIDPFALKCKLNTISLPDSKWAGNVAPYTQTAAAMGMTENAAVLVCPMEVNENISEIGRCEIRATAQAENSLTFSAELKPESETNFLIVNWGE